MAPVLRLLCHQQQPLLPTTHWVPSRDLAHPLQSTTVVNRPKAFTNVDFNLEPRTNRMHMQTSTPGPCSCVMKADKNTRLTRSMASCTTTSHSSIIGNPVAAAATWCIHNQCSCKHVHDKGINFNCACTDHTDTRLHVLTTHPVVQSSLTSQNAVSRLNHSSHKTVCNAVSIMIKQYLSSSPGAVCTMNVP